MLIIIHDIYKIAAYLDKKIFKEMY